MNWNDMVSNPQGLREIFQGDPPPLVGASLLELLVGRDGPSLRLRLDLPEFPSDPPPKWRRFGFNTVQVELLFGGVTDLSLTGVSTEVIADISIRHGEGISVDLVSHAMRLSARAHFVTVTQIGAYIAER